MQETISEVLAFLAERKRLFYYYIWDIDHAYRHGVDGLNFGPGDQQLARPEGTLDHAVLLGSLHRLGYTGQPASRPTARGAGAWIGSVLSCAPPTATSAPSWTVWPRAEVRPRERCAVSSDFCRTSNKRCSTVQDLRHGRDASGSLGACRSPPRAAGHRTERRSPNPLEKCMRRNVAFIAVAGAIAIGLAGCSAPAGSTPGASGSGDNAAVQKAEKALAAIVKGDVLSKGPHGETAAPATSADMTDAEIASVRAKHLTAAIVMHYGGNDWATAQIAGLKSEFGKLGIKVIATTDANFKPDQQVSQLETVMTQKPDLIVSIPTDPVATESAYKAVAAAGTKLVFMDNVPNGMTAGKDYVADVSADNYGNGVVSAYEMAKAIGGKGKIGVIFHQADFFVTKQRYQGFKETITKEFPNIQIVQETGIAGPDFAGQAQVAASAMLTKHPDLTGIWAVWDVPAEGCWPRRGPRATPTSRWRPRTSAPTSRSRSRRTSSWSDSVRSAPSTRG